MKARRAIAGLSWALLALGYLRFFSKEADTRWMVEETFALRDCLARGVTTGCREAGQFPLYQKLPTLLLAWLGLGPEGILRALGYLSLLAYLVLLGAGWRALKRPASWAWLGAMLLGPMLVYARASFGEMLAALLVLGAVLSLRREWARWKQAVLLAAVCLTKDFAAIFTVLLALAAAPGPGRVVWRQIAWEGILAGVALSLGFNFYRFGGPWNEAYLVPHQLVHDLRDRASFFAGLWLSPHGGVAVFWPLWTALAALLWARALGREPARALAIAAILGGLTLGLSGWYAPFGWVAWGPRLLLPWLPAVLFLLLDREPQMQGVVRRFAGPGWIIALLALNWPSFLVLFWPGLKEHVLAPDAAFPRVPVITEDANYYYRAMQHAIWPDHWRLLDAYVPGRAPWVAWLLAALATAWAARMLLRWRASLVTSG